jgi:hypothetical protein
MKDSIFFAINGASYIMGRSPFRKEFKEFQNCLRGFQERILKLN